MVSSSRSQPAPSRPLARAVALACAWMALGLTVASGSPAIAAAAQQPSMVRQAELDPDDSQPAGGDSNENAPNENDFAEVPLPVDITGAAIEQAVDDAIGPPPDELAAVDPANVALQVLIPEPGLLHPSLVEGLRIDTTVAGGSATLLREARLDQVDATERLLQSRADQSLGAVRITTLEGELDEGRTELANADEELARAQDDLSGFAVAAFVDFESIEAATLAPDESELSQRTLTDVAEDFLTESAADATTRQAEADGVVNTLEASLDDREQEVADAAAAEVVAEADRIDATERIERNGPVFERELLASNASGTDIPYVVLNAYVTAAAQTADEDPSCRVSWHHLAGIGKVESRHGSFGGNTVGPDGRTDGEILGPVLDGDPWLAIPDSDGGVYDGNLEWDRAVGPMQFIPTSWAIFGRDGNGDGETDPHNLYDAALAAAGHLCRRHSGLDSEPSFRQSLLGYNRSAVYGSDVIRISGEYLDLIDLPPTYS